MICKRCNHINDDGAKFCIKCGAPMDENYSQSQNIMIIDIQIITKQIGLKL